MKVDKSSLFWGLLLVGGGLLALASQFGWIDQFSNQVWMWLFALVGLIGLVSYLVSGFKQWAWLFPAGVFGGLAVVIGLADADVGSAAVATPLFVGLLIPFAAAYLTDRQRNWWALIPGGVMIVLALTTLLVDRVRGEWIGTLFLGMFALSFLVVYLTNRSRTWALIVAYVFGVLAIAPAMATGGELAAYFGSVFLFAIALPFFIVYLASKDNWWAIIPAGVLTIIAIIAYMAIAGWIGDGQAEYWNSILLGGLALIFAVVWLRHAQAWAMYAAIGSALVGIAFLFSSVIASEIIWAVAVILAGFVLLFNSLRSKPA
jgi:hypothetical protein